MAHAGRNGCVCCESCRSHIAPTRRCQAPYIMGLPLPSLTRFKVVRPIEVKADNIRLGYGATLERIQGDIFGSIHPPSGPFRYFMVLIDASTRWSHVCLLSSRNVAFARLLAQVIRLRAQFPDHPIKTIRLDNAGEFSSQTFLDYCMSIGNIMLLMFILRMGWLNLLSNVCN